MRNPLRSSAWRYLGPLALLPALSLGTAAPLAAAPHALFRLATPPADITITGQVLDEKGAGLPGVNVIVKGTSNGAQTDVNGRYSITAPDDATLVFSFVGYVAKEVAVAGKTTVSLSLAPDAAGLDEVVVVGYGV